MAALISEPRVLRLLLIIAMTLPSSLLFEDWSVRHGAGVQDWKPCPSPTLPFGRVRLRKQGTTAKFQCRPGKILWGAKYATCIHGKWDQKPPVCVQPGCRPLVPLVKGTIMVRFQGAVAMLICNPGHYLITMTQAVYGRRTYHPGDRNTGVGYIYCDGLMWNATGYQCLAMRTTATPSTQRTVAVTTLTTKVTYPVTNWSDIVVTTSTTEYPETTATTSAPEVVTTAVAGSGSIADVSTDETSTIIMDSFPGTSPTADTTLPPRFPTMGTRQPTRLTQSTKLQLSTNLRQSTNFTQSTWLTNSTRITQWTTTARSSIPASVKPPTSSAPPSTSSQRLQSTSSRTTRGRPSIVTRASTISSTKFYTSRGSSSLIATPSTMTPEIVTASPVTWCDFSGNPVITSVWKRPSGGRLVRVDNETVSVPTMCDWSPLVSRMLTWEVAPRRNPSPSVPAFKRPEGSYLRVSAVGVIRYAWQKEYSAQVSPVYKQSAFPASGSLSCFSFWYKLMNGALSVLLDNYGKQSLIWISGSDEPLWTFVKVPIKPRGDEFRIIIAANGTGKNWGASVDNLWLANSSVCNTLNNTAGMSPWTSAPRTSPRTTTTTRSTFSTVAVSRRTPWVPTPPPMTTAATRTSQQTAPPEGTPGAVTWSSQGSPGVDSSEQQRGPDEGGAVPRAVIWSAAAASVLVLLLLLGVLARRVVNRRRTKLREGGDGDSDVRYLTSDEEHLDFSLQRVACDDL